MFLSPRELCFLLFFRKRGNTVKNVKGPCSLGAAPVLQGGRGRGLLSNCISPRFPEMPGVPAQQAEAIATTADRTSKSNSIQGKQPWSGVISLPHPEPGRQEGAVGAVCPTAHRSQEGVQLEPPWDGSWSHSHPLLRKYCHKDEAGSGGRADAPGAIRVSQQDGRLV